MLNLKDIIIKKLQGDNERLHLKVKYLEVRMVDLETSQNHLDQYGRRNNIVLSGIPNGVADKQLHSTMILTLFDIEVTVEPRDGEDCNRVGNPDESNSKESIIHFFNQGNYKKNLTELKKHKI